MKKNTLSFLFISFLSCLLLFPFESCRKGSGDPMISFRSRKARVAGEWKVTKKSTTKTTTTTFYSPPDSSETDLEKHVNDGVRTTRTVTKTFKGSHVDSTNTTTDAIGETWEYSFKKDGTFTATNVITETYHDTTTLSNGYDYGRTIKNTSTSAILGKWDFTDGVGDTKKRERIILDITKNEVTTVHSESYTLTFTGEIDPPAYPDDHIVTSNEYLDNQEIWMLGELRDKSMKANGTGHSSIANTKNSIHTSVTTLIDQVFSIELEAK